MPRAAHRPAEHLRGRRVIKYLFGRGIKSNLAAQQHRNLAQVARRCRAVRNLGGRQSRLSALDTIKEVTPMTRRLEKVYFIRPDLLFEYFLGLGIHSAAVNPDPTIPADPLGSAADVAV